MSNFNFNNFRTPDSSFQECLTGCNEIVKLVLEQNWAGPSRDMGLHILGDQDS